MLSLKHRTDGLFIFTCILVNFALAYKNLYYKDYRLLTCCEMLLACMPNFMKYKAHCCDTISRLINIKLS